MKKENGFSLVELSIVLVILGLLTGGILGGQELIKAAELRRITTEFTGFQTAVNTFKSKYSSLPGDTLLAERLWGAATCPGTAGSGTQTCNGNGDGRVSAGSTASQYTEQYTFWQHLANAQLVAGEYTGMAGSASGQDANLGVNAPKSGYGNAGWTVRHCLSGGCGGEDYALDYGNHYTLGAASASWDTDAPALTPTDAWNIDTKMDDGQPAKGSIVALYFNNLCAAADDGSHQNTDFEASYKLSDSSVRCALVFRNAF